MQSLFDRKFTQSVADLANSYLTRTPTPQLIDLAKDCLRPWNTEEKLLARSKDELKADIERIMYPFVVDDDVMSHFDAKNLYPDPRFIGHDVDDQGHNGFVACETGFNVVLRQSFPLTSLMNKV